MAVSHVASSFGISQVSSFSGNMSSSMGAGNVSSRAFTYTPTTTGNIVMFYVVIVPSTTSPTTVTLSAAGWSFTQIGGITGNTTAGCGAMFWAYAPNTGAATITVTWNQPTNTWMSDLIDEFSGMETSVPIAGNNAAVGSGTPTVSLTPTNNNCMVWVACNDALTASGNIGGSAATKGADDAQQDFAEYRVLTGGSGISQSCDFSGSGTYVLAAAAIRPAGSDPTIGSVPAGTALAKPAFTAKFLFFDTGDYGIGL